MYTYADTVLLNTLLQLCKKDVFVRYIEELGEILIITREDKIIKGKDVYKFVISTAEAIENRTPNFESLFSAVKKFAQKRGIALEQN
jgi:hypothetical protein